MNQDEYSHLLDYLDNHNTQLVAVSKTRTIDQLMRLYSFGQQTFGENRVQELLQKVNQLPDHVQWHMIGHLQSNKVKQIAPFISVIHSVDSFKLLKEIDKQAKINNRTIDCLLQFKIALEDTKHGLNVYTAEDILSDSAFTKLENCRIIGVMGMATFTSNKLTVRKEFKKLKSIFNQLKSDFFEHKPEFKEISMGMSGDYKLAIEEGSTMVRIGSLLF